MHNVPVSAEEATQADEAPIECPNDDEDASDFADGATIFQHRKVEKEILEEV